MADGIEVVEDNTDKVVEEIGSSISRALEKIGLAAERYAKENLTANKSVITGRLRNS